MSDTGTFPAIEEADVVPDVDGWWQELNMLDDAGCAAIAATPTPELDRFFRRVSRAADHWKLWLGSAAVLAIAGGSRGRRSAVNGPASELDDVGHLGFHYGPADQSPMVTGMDIARTRDGVIIELYTMVTEIRRPS
jgi:hypothetical protein